MQTIVCHYIVIESLVQFRLSLFCSSIGHWLHEKSAIIYQEEKPIIVFIKFNPSYQKSVHDKTLGIYYDIYCDQDIAEKWD
jgi:hypothetical protein